MNRIAVTIPEAVVMSGIGRTSFYELFKSGEIVPRKKGRRTLILVNELQAYLENLPTPAEAA